ncbi:hypothetical protein EYF80_066925 [Liparis tanakae]|uniref:Uncharacterized protein n=1 Tax=Liparis tanakae TaxID=230148 RepID=A0A4Z2E2G2_9TELE|nr:hypothetical protein EYF80_066925 [Liparis tanakae]
MLYMCAKLGLRGAIRGNVKQLRMSAYIGLTVTQSTPVTPLLPETNNGAVFPFGAVKTEGPVSISSSLSPRFFFTCAFPAANGHPDVS